MISGALSLKSQTSCFSTPRLNTVTLSKPAKKNVTFIRQTHPKNSSICALSIAFGPHKVLSQEFLVLTDEQVVRKHRFA